MQHESTDQACFLQELKRHGVNSKDCTSALESVFGVSSRGRIRVNLDHVEDEPNEEESVCGTEGDPLLNS